jgi:hypothetical protein
MSHFKLLTSFRQKAHEHLREWVKLMQLKDMGDMEKLTAHVITNLRRDIP